MQIPLELIESVLVYAIQSVEFDLNIVSQRYQKKGIKSVDDIQSPTINGKNFEKSYLKKPYSQEPSKNCYPNLRLYRHENCTKNVT